MLEQEHLQLNFDSIVRFEPDALTLAVVAGVVADVAVTTTEALNRVRLVSPQLLHSHLVFLSA